MDTTRNEKIKQFIDEYFLKYYKSPTVRDIAAGIGVSKTTAQRHLMEMKEKGELVGDGFRGLKTNFARTLIEATPATRYEATVSCGVPTETDVGESEILPLPTAIVGKGKFFVLTAKGDSMINIGIADGDTVIVREQNFCNDGDYAVALVNGSETVLKTITHLPNERAYLLHAENENYPDRIEKDVLIQGVATHIIKVL